MMANRVKYIEPKGLTAKYIEHDSPDTLDYEVREGWKSEPPRDEWTEWTPWEVEHKQETGSIRPSYNYDETLFKNPTIHSLRPEVKTVYVRYRKLIRRWVDKTLGPMAKVLDTEYDRHTVIR